MTFADVEKIGLDLDSATKIIESFENPKAQPEKVEEPDGNWRERQLSLFGGGGATQKGLFEESLPVEPTTTKDLRTDRDMPDPAGERANGAIDEYAEQLWHDLVELKSAKGEDAEAIEERIANATANLEAQLVDFYKGEGNLERDAVQAARDMSRQVRAEVSVAMVKRGLGEVATPADKPAARLLSEKEAADLIEGMKSKAIFVPELKLSAETWRPTIETPLGVVKMGEHQQAKLIAKGRIDQFGMMIETLSNPDVILEENGNGEKNYERPTSYLFIKTFKKSDGAKYVHFESVTVSQGGMEVSVSSHIIRENQLKNKMKSDRLLYKATALDKSANSSAEQPINKGGSLSSDDKVSENAVKKQVSELKVTETAGGDVVSYESMGEMRKLGKGEFTLVERKFSESGEFGFTGKEKIESIDDVAYIFRALEDFSNENAFVALVKDGKVTVVHVGGHVIWYACCANFSV